MFWRLNARAQTPANNIFKLLQRKIPLSAFFMNELD